MAKKLAAKPVKQYWTAIPFDPPAEPVISEAEKAKVRQLARDAAARDRLAARRNAWPVYAPGALVRVDVWGFRYSPCRVVSDAGLASDPTRKIVIEKCDRPGERITVRRDRAVPVPG